MNDASPPSESVPEGGGGRAPRGRLLVVGDESLALAVRDRLLQAPVRAVNLFEAIGEIAGAPAARPIVAALIDESCVTGPGRRGPEAIHRLDPSVQLVAVRHNGDSSSGPPAGFDGVIPAPVDPDALARLLGGARFTRGGVTPPPEIAPAETSPAAAPPAPLSSPAPPPSPSPPPPPPAPPAGPDPRRAVAAAAPGPRRDAAPPATGLGDTDLVEAVMHDPGGVTATALDLVREHTGWSDLALDPDAEATPAGKAASPVRGAGRVFGALTTGRAARRELAPWAEWLGRWLALDSAFREYRRMAFQDELTGTWNRRYFSHFLERTIAEARQLRRPVTVMVFDIDDFKRYNDEFSHEAGDVILRETVDLLHSVIRVSDRVCRIGGDEFAVIFADLDEPRESGSRHPDSVEAIARRFQAQICAMRFPKLGLQAPGTLSISAGLATFPWDGSDAASLLRLADERALESKRRGKNSITFGPGAARGEV